MQWVEWCEPFGVGSHAVIMRVTKEAAIEKQKMLAAPGHIYPSDERALEDFMACHWAELRNIGD